MSKKMSSASTSRSTSDASAGGPSIIVKVWLILSNVIICYGWAKVLRTIIEKKTLFFETSRSLIDINDPVCKQIHEVLSAPTRMALYLSFLEFMNAGLGFTRSKLSQVLLFSSVRFGVEMLLAPLVLDTGDNYENHTISCFAPTWSHIFTVLLWSIGDTVRFGCFAFDNLFTMLNVDGNSFWARIPKGIRYTVGPMLFPLGTMGEMLMVYQAATNNTGRWYLWVVMPLWPLGFYPLMKQLLKQRSRFFAPKDKKKQIKYV